MARPLSMKIGTKFHYLTVLERVSSPVKGQTRWLCRCDCGNDVEVYATHLRSGNTKSCGCQFLIMQRAAKLTHGMTRSPTYWSWHTMKQRCTNPSSPDYHQYGGRGIRVCERWVASFEAFLSDMGIRPDGKTLDRIDSNGHYEPANCRWATRTEQQNNRRRTIFLTYNGETRALADWARHFGIATNTLYMRVTKYHWPLERAFTP